jgi:hypothetical protein
MTAETPSGLPAGGEARLADPPRRLGPAPPGCARGREPHVPADCAHGFQALTDPADVSYRINRPHDPTEDVSIAFDDPELAIPWPLPVTIMSQRDQAASSLAAATKLFTS